MTEHQGLPVAGYKPTQPQDAIDLVNEGKHLEERVRRWFDKINQRTIPGGNDEPRLIAGFNPRLLAIAREQCEIGMTFAYKSVFQLDAGRIKLPEEALPPSGEE